MSFHVSTELHLIIYIKKTPNIKKEENDVIKRKSNRYYYTEKLKFNYNFKAATPMKHLFTYEEMRPSERTIQIIKQIAYTYRTIKMNGKYEVFCLN